MSASAQSKNLSKKVSVFMPDISEKIKSWRQKYSHHVFHGMHHLQEELFGHIFSQSPLHGNLVEQLSVRGEFCY